MTTEPIPNPQFTCKACQGTVPLDDVQLLMSDGRRCLCYRCWRGATAQPQSDLPPEPPPIPQDGAHYQRWWCTWCRAGKVLAVRGVHRPDCPVCGHVLRRWDEQWRPRGTGGAV